MPTLLQLSDLHLFADRSALLKGVNPWESLERVLETIRRRQIAFDHLILTGDLAHDGQRNTYEQLRQALGNRADTAQAIPGNHDDRQHVGQVFNLSNDSLASPSNRVTFAFSAGAWRVLGLDTLLPGSLRGELGAAQLAWLENELAANRDALTLIFLHHPPVEAGSAWLDKIGLTDRELLCRLIDSSPQVKLICCGHIHQEFESWIGSATVLAAPATSVQFTPGTETLVVDDLPPGFRIIRLLDRGYETEVVRAA